MRKVDINGRIFEIDGDKSSDYYTVFGTTQKEVQEHQHKLESFVPSKLSSGRFTKLSDAKEFIRIVVDASKTKRYYKSIYGSAFFDGLFYIDEDAKKHTLYNTYKVLEKRFGSFFGEFTEQQLSYPCFEKKYQNPIPLSQFFDVLVDKRCTFSFELTNIDYKQSLVDAGKQSDLDFVYRIIQARSIDDVIKAFNHKSSIVFTLSDFKELGSTHCKTVSCCEMIYNKNEDGEK